MKSKNRSFSVLLIFFAFSIIGLSMLPLLSVKLNPEKSINSLRISYGLPDAPPLVLEQTITTPLEAALNRLPEVRKISSVSNYSKGEITIEFDKDVAADKFRFQVASVIRYLYPNFPENAPFPTLQMLKPGEDQSVDPLLTYTISANQNKSELENYIQKILRPQFADIEGLKEIKVSGGNQLAYYLYYKNDEMQTLGITKSNILNCLNQFFKKQSLGTINFENIGGNQQFYLQLDNFQRDWQWRDLVVKKVGDRIIYLEDICNIVKKELPPTNFFRINGEQTLYLRFYAQPTANRILVSKNIEKRVDECKLLAPDDYSFICSYNSSEYIEKELSKIVWRTVLTLVILLVFVLAVSFSWRYVVVIALSIFINISVSFILYYLFGVQIHLFSLAGVAISLGLIIDNSIVMADHIRLYRNNRAYLAILASTLTTVSALAIITLLPENLRLNLLDMGVVVIINILISLLVSLWFIPAIIEQIGFSRKKRKIIKIRHRRLIHKIGVFYQKCFTLCLRWRTIVLLIALFSFGIPLFILPEKMEGDGVGDKVYNATFGSSWYNNNLRVGLNKYLGGTLRLFYYNVFEGSYFVENKETKLNIYASMPKGHTLAQINVAMAEIERFLLGYPQIKQFSAKIYSPQNASIEVLFKPKYEFGTFPYYLKSQIIRKSLDFGGISWHVSGVGKGFSNGGTSVSENLNQIIQIRGYNYDHLADFSVQIEKRLKEHKRIDKVDNNAINSYRERNRPYRFNFVPNSYDATIFNQSLSQMQQSMKLRSDGNSIDYYLDDGKKRIPVIVKSEQSNYFDKWDMFNRPYQMKKPYKFQFFGDVEKSVGDPPIHKVNQEYIRNIRFRYNGTNKFANRYRKKVKEEFKKQLPMGYKIYDSGGFNFYDTSEPSQIYLIFVIIASIFLICAILFESFRQSLAIIALIPLSFIGVFLTFYLFELNFDTGGYASFIMLCGITVNSAIYLVNEFNSLKKRKSDNFPQTKLYLKAFQHKITPIFLTVISSALGLLPFVFMGEKEPFWFAFSSGVIGGLLFSLLMIIIFLPVLLLRKKRD